MHVYNSDVVCAYTFACNGIEYGFKICAMQRRFWMRTILVRALTENFTYLK